MSVISDMSDMRYLDGAARVALGDPETIAGAAWRSWHAHLYSCAVCGTGARCAQGARLLADAKATDREDYNVG